MNKYKGLIVQAQIQEKQYHYKVQEIIAEGGFSYIYSTDNPDVIVKIQVISMPEIRESFLKEKEVLVKLKEYNNKGIIQFYFSVQIDLNNQQLGILCMQNCSGGNLFTLLEKANGDLPEKNIIGMLSNVISSIDSMHKLGLAHRDIKLQNVLVNKKGEFKLCDFGSVTSNHIKSIDNKTRPQIEQQIQKKTTPMYRSPEQLDLYSGYQIGPQVDIFAFGCIAFILCFKKQPFESRLAAINNQYFVPQKCIYSQGLLNLIKNCFIPNPKLRPNSEQVIFMLDDLKKSNQNNKINKYHKIDLDKELENWSNLGDKIKILNAKETVKGSLMDKMKKYYTQLTTQTQGWVSAFLQESEECPSLKYTNCIVSKCWQKRYKIEKFYKILQVVSEKNITKSIVILKLLLLIHNFLRKGPPQACAETVDKNHISLICLGVFNQWAKMNVLDRNQDKIRNQFIRIMIVIYSLVLLMKVDCMIKYADVMEGNYSLAPFFASVKPSKILDVKIIQSFLKMLQRFIDLHKRLKSMIYLKEIQEGIMQELFEEECCLMNTIIHLYSALKHGTNYLDIKGLDQEAIKTRFSQLEQKIQQSLKEMKVLWGNSMQIQQKKHTVINLEVIKHLENIPILLNKSKETFEIQKILNETNSICGYALPVSYELLFTKSNRVNNKYKKQNPQECLQMRIFQKKIEQKREKLIENNKNDLDKIKKQPQQKQKQSHKDFFINSQNLFKQDVLGAENKQQKQFSNQQFQNFFNFSSETQMQQEKKQKMIDQNQEPSKKKEEQIIKNIEFQCLKDISLIKFEEGTPIKPSSEKESREIVVKQNQNQKIYAQQLQEDEKPIQFADDPTEEKKDLNDPVKIEIKINDNNNQLIFFDD